MFKPEISPDIPSTLEKEVGEVSVYLENFLKDETTSEREKRLHEYLLLLKDAFSDKENYIDHGGAAKVYSFGVREICIKIMTNRHASENKDLYDLGNSPLIEFELMERLHDFSVAGVRSPIAEACIESGNSAAIIMEKLDAVNVQHVLNGTEKMPENFESEKFFESFETYLQALHEEKKIAHMDLFPRNIMVDRITGEAYVIDFGRSELLQNLSEEDRKKKINDDWNKYDLLYRELEKLLRNEEVISEVIPKRSETHKFDPSTKIYYSESIDRVARHIAKKLLQRDDDVLNVPLGSNNKDLFVSKNKDLVIGVHNFVLEGVDFWVGVKK